MCVSTLESERKFCWNINNVSALLEFEKVN